MLEHQNKHFGAQRKLRRKQEAIVPPKQNKHDVVVRTHQKNSGQVGPIYRTGEEKHCEIETANQKILCKSSVVMMEELSDGFSLGSSSPVQT